MDDRARTPLPAWGARMRARLAPLLLGAASLLFFAVLIGRHPTMFWFDAYARVLEREHIVVSRWLPMVQVVVYVVSKLTTNISHLRVVFAAIAAATVVSAAIFGARLFTYWTGLIFAALLATNALFAALSIVPYQEVLFLGLAFVSLLLHERRTSRSGRWAAAVCFNLLCLTRYEGSLLVAILGVTELATETQRSHLTSGARAAIGLCTRYGAVAVGWLVALASRSEMSRLWHPTVPTFGQAGRHLATYVYRTVWELGSCPPRRSPWIGISVAIVLAMLAILGLIGSILHRPRRQQHATIIGFVIAAIVLIILVDPYTSGNLRETFLPVVFALLYAAEGLRLLAGSALVPISATRQSFGTRSAATAAGAGFIIGLSAYGADKFIATSSDEPDFRLPAAVGRELARIRAARPGYLRVVTLRDNAMDRGIIALYGGLPLEEVEALSSDVPARATHVVSIPRSGEAFSGPASALERSLERGSLPAAAVRIDSAVIWTLRAPNGDAAD